MKTRKCTALADFFAVFVAFGLVITACEGPMGPEGKPGADGKPGDTIINIEVDGIVESADIAAAVERAVETAQGENDGSTPETALSLSFSGFSTGDDAAMKALFLGIEGYYVNLDLSGLNGTAYPYYALFPGVDKSRILSLILPGTITVITNGASASTGAFSGYTGLKTVTAEGVVTVGNYAFSGCTALESISLPVATSIGGAVFYRCTALENVSLPVATSIDGSAFSGCTALESISLPVATSIGGGVFSGCTALENVSLPVATDIGSQIFYGCTALESVSLPVVTDIGTSAFYGCTALESISLPVATNIGSSAFSGCTALESISLPVATNIGTYTFSDCTALESVSLPAVTSIGSQVFPNCTALESVSIPAIETIGEYIFSGIGLQSLTVTMGANAPKVGRYIFNNIYEGEAKIVTVKVPSGASGYGSLPFTVTGYESTNNWGNAFRGIGWNGKNYLSGSVNSSISLTIETI